MIGKTDYDMPWHNEADGLRESDVEVMDNKKTITREEVSKVKGSDQVSIFLSKKAPLLNESGAVIGILGISFDITDRKKMEEALRLAKEKAEVANRAKTEFIANMGHDIRTPLTGIIGFSQYLEEEIQNPERKACAHQIYESGEQLLYLLNGILDLIMADEVKETDVVEKPLDVYKLVHDVLDLEMPAVQAKHVVIEVNIDSAVPQYVKGDKLKLHRILLNFVSNAIKFTEKGKIIIGLSLKGKEDKVAHLCFSVKDTGIGIAKTFQEKIFERFFKVTPSYKGLYKGNGLGLYIASKYANLLHGKIEVESEAGKGATFSFTVPLSLSEKPVEEEKLGGGSIVDKPVEAKPLKTADKKVSNAPRVLLVEDSIPAMAVLALQVKKFPVSVSQAVDAETAFELIEQQPFDLLITDLGLPGKQGNELSKMTREYEHEHQRKRMKIVALTGHALGEITKACIESGMDDVYRKPITPAIVQKLIESLGQTLPQEPAKKGLGLDLPETEAELFEIGKHPLFDLKVAVDLLGDEGVARDILKNLKKDGIDPDLGKINAAHEAKDWVTVESLAHKMKSGAMYGTVRLYYAFLYMERYLKAGHTQCAEKLYEQMLRVIDETVAYLDKWVKR